MHKAWSLVAEVVQKCFYIDDCLTSADDSALILQEQLASLFAYGSFLLRKWNSSDSSALQRIPVELRATRDIQTINQYTKTLDIKWNISTDEFRLTINQLRLNTATTKRTIVSDVA